MPTDLYTEQQLIRNESRSNIQWIYALVTQQYRIYNLVSLHINYNQSATTHAHCNNSIFCHSYLQVFVRFFDYNKDFCMCQYRLKKCVVTHKSTNGSIRLQQLIVLTYAECRNSQREVTKDLSVYGIHVNVLDSILLGVQL